MGRSIYKAYYYDLANAGSYWGKLIYSLLLREEGKWSLLMIDEETEPNSNQSCVDDPLYPELQIRIEEVVDKKRSLSLEMIEENEKFRILKLNAPGYFLMLLDYVTGMLAVPTLSFLLYIPFHIIRDLSPLPRQQSRSERSFIVTNEIVTEALSQVPKVPDNLPPAAPANLGVQ